MSEEQKQDQKFSKFHGVNREEIQWNPEIDENKCIGCGLCVTSCGRNVYKYDYENKKAKVVNPNNCLVGCQTCSNLCPAKAIKFAEEDKTREKAQKIVKDINLLPKIKNELEIRKEELNINN